MRRQANIADQDYFTLEDPDGVVTSFWFQTDGNDTENPASIAAVAAGEVGSQSIELDIQAATTETTVAEAIVAAVNLADIGLLADNVAGVVYLQATTGGTAGNSWIITEAVADAGFTRVAPAHGQAANPAITDGGTLDMALTGTASFVLTLAISNVGELALTLTNPATLGGTSNTTAVELAAPSATVASGASTEHTITVDPTIEGAWSFTYSIVNNDANENPFNFTVSGFAITP